MTLPKEALWRGCHNILFLQIKTYSKEARVKNPANKEKGKKIITHVNITEK
jgi:hypothetical protein